MELPEKDKNYSLRLSLIKRYFTRRMIPRVQQVAHPTKLSLGPKEALPTKSMKKHRNRGIWQKRFWEHRIRNEKDYVNHVNYIHYNPVKHKLVDNVAAWPWSTYHKYKMQGREDDPKMMDLYDESEPGFIG